jgi:hypothetical protein
MDEDTRRTDISRQLMGRAETRHPLRKGYDEDQDRIPCIVHTAELLATWMAVRQMVVEGNDGNNHVA